jgi:hypothetical protein
MMFMCAVALVLASAASFALGIDTPQMRDPYMWLSGFASAWAVVSVFIQFITKEAL